MTGQERIRAALAHESGDELPVDFSGTSVTGLHVSVVAELRRYYGLPEEPVKVWRPYQMLGEVADDLARFLHSDTVSVAPRSNMFGYANEEWKEWRTPWGQVVLVGKGFEVDELPDGSVEIYPAGDRSAARSGRMPAGGFFFDAIVRQSPVSDEDLTVEDNLEEYGPVSPEDLDHYRRAAFAIAADRQGASPAGRSSGAAIFHFGGTALGDISDISGVSLRKPKGIRDVEEWYISTVTRTEHLKEVFSRQTDIALANLEKLHAVVGEVPEMVYVCGTDFGTQTSQFCSVDQFNDLWAPFYARINGWIHANTNWKTFKHSCGAVEPLIESFIACGFDVLNPVQTGAAGMDPTELKRKYGDRIVFWGGGVDTQKTLPFGSPEDVRDEVRRHIDAFLPGGGYVFNTIHNIQARTPVENVVAMIDAVGEYRKRG